MACHHQGMVQTGGTPPALIAWSTLARTLILPTAQRMIAPCSTRHIAAQPGQVRPLVAAGLTTLRYIRKTCPQDVLEGEAELRPSPPPVAHLHQ